MTFPTFAYYWVIFATNKLVRLVSKELNHCGGHFACVCRMFEFYEAKKNIIIFKKENGNTFTFLIIFIVKSLQKEQNSLNLLLCRNKPAITPKWFNSLDTNSRFQAYIECNPKIIVLLFMKKIDFWFLKSAASRGLMLR